MKGFISWIAISLFLAAIASAVLAYTYEATAFFAPKYAEVRNDVFKNTQAYHDGMVNDLSDLRLQYMAASNHDHKAAIRATVLHRFATYPKDRLPAELREFFFSLWGEI